MNPVADCHNLIPTTSLPAFLFPTANAKCVRFFTHWDTVSSIREKLLVKTE